MDKQQKDIAYFLSFCIEQYKNAKGMSGEETVLLSDKYGVLEYLHDFYDVLHTQSHEWLLAEVDEFISIRQKEEMRSSHKTYPSNCGLVNDKEIASIMTGEINQGNVHLLLPSKVCWLAPWLAEDDGISLIEAVKRVYSSSMYKQLEIESTKMWHLGPVDLYRELRDKD